MSWSKNDKDHPSPLEFLVTDSAHKDEKVRQVYQNCFDSLVDRLSGILLKRGITQPKEVAEETVISLVGTVTIARSFNAVRQSDFIKRAQERIINTLNSHSK